MLASEYILVTVLYVLLIYDIWDLILMKIQKTKSEKRPLIKQKHFKFKHSQYKSSLIGEEEDDDLFDGGKTVDESLFPPAKSLEDAAAASTRRRSSTINPMKNIDDQWEAKRVRSRKISRAYKTPPTASQLLARAIADDPGCDTSHLFERINQEDAFGDAPLVLDDCVKNVS